jgi:ABC-type bacteriocin/lantibiotic exporter with double-glycine peptidase domain
MMPIIQIPVVKQKLPHDCGEAVFRSICKYLKLSAIQWNTPDSDPLNGLHPFELEPAFRRMGLDVSAGTMDLDDLRHHAKKSRPVACLVRYGDSGHWVVSGGVARGFVWIMEPFDGLWKGIREDEFLNQWQDYDRAGTVFRRFGISVGK